jgi:hypothetical protein
MCGQIRLTLTQVFETARPFESANFHGLDRKDLKSENLSDFFLSYPVFSFSTRMIRTPG